MNPPVEKVIVAHCGPRGEARSVDHAKELAQMRSHFPSADYEELFSFLMEWKKVDVAIKKYQAFLEWAKVNLPITREETLTVAREGKYFFHGRARDGAYMVYFRVCLHDPALCSPDLFVRHVLFQVWETVKAAQAQGEYATVRLIMDRTGASRKTFDVELLKRFFHDLMEYVPFRLTHVVVYNVNSVFKNALWPLIRVFLPEVLKNLVDFTNSLDGITRYVDMDELPPYLKKEFNGVEKSEQE